MTDATGRSFISYRRTRLNEARLLVEALHDVGVPTWQDLSDLSEGHTDELLREVLAAETTANSVCWLTPDVEKSDVIIRTELPSIMKRIDRNDSFFMVPIAAGGLRYDEVTRVVGTYLGLHDLGQWNVRKVASDPISFGDAAYVARQVLKRRIQEISKQRRSGEPLRMVLNTRKRPAFEPGVALSLDWTHHFEGRLAKPQAWDDFFLPALETVAQTCEQYASGRSIVAEGLCALPATVALGTAFLTTRGIPVAWRQNSPNRPAEFWSLTEKPEPSGFTARLCDGNVSADDLALLVSVASNVEPAFTASRQHLPAFRALLVVTKPGNYPHDIQTPGEAVDIIRVISQALRQARDNFQPRGKIHLFLAVPAGLAMMLGQTLNTFGQIQTYEHVGTDAVGMYQSAALLKP
ncbi:MAG TPA: SAVED domain-containing protein [Candidatus Binatia bacterium]